ncbi:MAG: carbohydrate binding family 9 domain-containing protein [bacterium]|nr:carbohydrate binding family 9 domain-containing protein [bacterium]
MMFAKKIRHAKLGILFILLLLLFIGAPLLAQKKVYTTGMLSAVPPVIDGDLNDDAWDNAEWGGDFIQKVPDEGKSSTQKTGFKILYDNKNLYIAVRAYDNEPDKIVRRISRRDNLDGDWVAVDIDSYHDLSTAFGFKVNAAGVKGDEIITDNGSNRNANWDPVWIAKTAVDSKGWSAEMCIPLDQLRFADVPEHVWGLQLSRKLFRSEEQSNWQHIPRNAPGQVHLFGELRGLSNIKPKRKIGLIPYTVAKAERFEKELDNPFATGSLNGITGGLDGKFNLSSDLTIDFTINPDFGQVEADPSEVNLTAFETFFQEKRPFFIEGKNIINFRLMVGDGTYSSDNLFYTRRIGRSPQHSPDLDDDEYIDMPGNTSILGAFKLTGKTKKGLSIAILNGITAEENAEIAAHGERRFDTVEPLTNYFIMRVQKDYKKGNTKIGGMMTATNRNLKNPVLNFLHRSAYTGGFDFSHSWKEKVYSFSIKTVFSRVAGDTEAILRTQESSRRYFQRPDATHVSLDPNRTSLSGYGGNFSFTKNGNGNFNYAGGVTWRSPGLELNDAGYLRSADVIMQWLWAGYRILKPFSIFRQVSFSVNQWQGWNFGREHTFNGGNFNFNTLFKNYMSAGVGINFQGDSLSASMLRGGPALKWVGGFSNWYNFSSDNRKKIRLSMGGYNFWSNYNNARNNSVWFSFSYRPSSMLSISLSPSYRIAKKALQYVDTIESDDKNHFLMAEMDQKTLGLTLRLNYCITPNLSIQFYGQPFISTGLYNRFRNVINPRADQPDDRYHFFNANEISYDVENESYNVDANSDGVSDFSIDTPDFKFLQFRSNLVLRWEYRPGSAVFLVWSQGRTNSTSVGDFSFRNDMNDLFHVQPHNVFLAKFTYRFQI